MDRLVYYLLSAVAALIALTVHEYCHGYAAYKLGDDTAKNFGRLTSPSAVARESTAVDSDHNA